MGARKRRVELRTMPPPLDPKETVPPEISARVLEPTVPAPTADAVTPVIADRYAIERELGRGGMGVVYLARDQKLHQKPVVIKVLLEDAMRDEWTVRKFQQEKEALARVDHPGVVGILDTGELPDGKPFIVMQYIEGISLGDAMKPEGMAFERAASIIRQIGDALSAVHDKNIYHRDLKPQNIMLQTRSHGDEQVKIVDFGIAKVKDSVVGPSTVTGASTAGTIVYMSPEHLRGEKVTSASDIYSFGVIAYEMVTGRRPFHPDTVAHLAEMQREGVQARPSALRPRLSEEAEKLILSALEFEPQARPQNAAEFGAALASALMGDEETLKRPAVEKEQELTVVAEATPSSEQSLNGDQKAVFISYSQADKKAAETICKSLEKAALSCWIAPRNIPPGKTWAEFIPDAISNSRCMVLIVSANANESRQVKKEVDIADNKNIPIIPFRIQNVALSKALEYHLAGTQWLDAYTPPITKHIQQLEETVRSMIGREGSEISPLKPRPVPWRLIAAAAAIVIVAGIIGGVWMMRPTAAQPTLTYSLTVQKMIGRQKDGAEFQSAGQESSGYGNGWRYRMNIMAGQAGYLYILNEGTVNDNVLFPTEPNKNRVNANEAMQLPPPQPNLPGGWYFFDDNPGVERVRIIFSVEPLSELDTIVRDAVNNARNTGDRRIAITDPAQVKIVRDLIARYGNTNAIVDDANKRSVINGTGNVMTSLLELEHKPQ